MEAARFICPWSITAGNRPLPEKPAAPGNIPKTRPVGDRSRSFFNLTDRIEVPGRNPHPQASQPVRIRSAGLIRRRTAPPGADPPGAGSGSHRYRPDQRPPVQEAGLTLERLFSDQTGQDLAEQKAVGEALSGEELADLDLYYHLVLNPPDRNRAADLTNWLNSLALVEIAYPMPIPSAADVDIPRTTVINPPLTQRYMDPDSTRHRCPLCLDISRRQGRQHPPDRC